MTEIRLDRTRVVAIVGELVAAGVAEHVGMCLGAEMGQQWEAGNPPENESALGRSH
jgi:hypothetical protein